MYWYRFALTESQIGAGGLRELEKGFEEHVFRPKAQKSACVLREWEPYDPEAVFYICAESPLGEEVLIRLFSARPCVAPSLRSVRFWYGDVKLNEALPGMMTDGE